MKTSANTSKPSPTAPTRLCLSDNDWVAKLAAFDLIPDALKRMHISKENVRILGTCRAVVCGRRLTELYGAGMAARAEAFINSVSSVEDQLIDDADFVQLTNEGIDDGEAQFFANNFPGVCLIATDDKRAMLKLATKPGLARIHQRHIGRVVCVAQVIVSVAELLGCDYVDSKVRPMCLIDQRVEDAWAGGSGRSPKECVKHMRAHIAELNASTKGLLCQF